MSRPFFAAIIGLLMIKAAEADTEFVASVQPVDGYPAGASIPTAPSAPTAKDFSAIYASWLDRVLKANCRRSHPEDPALIDYVSQGCEYLLSGDDNAQAELNVRVGGLERAGVQDGAVWFIASLATDAAESRERRLRLAITGFQKNSYPRFLLFTVAANLAKTLADRNANAAEIADADRLALQLLKDSLNAESFQPGEMSALRWRLCSQSFESLLKRRGGEVRDIFRQAAGVAEWVREFGQGKALLAAAWVARTDDWSDKVTEAGWKGWAENLASAREHFTHSWRLNPRDPAAAACMIEVAMGDKGDKKEMRQWFDRAVAAEMDYHDAYRAFIWGLQPRWSGSHAEMLQCGDECLETRRFDTCVPNYYFKVVSDVASEEPDPKEIYQRAEISHNLLSALNSYFATPNMPLIATYGHTMAAVLEYRRGNFSGARAQMDAIKLQPNPKIGKGLAEDIPKMMREITRQ